MSMASLWLVFSERIEFQCRTSAGPDFENVYIALQSLLCSATTAVESHRKHMIGVEA